MNTLPTTDWEEIVLHDVVNSAGRPPMTEQEFLDLTKDLDGQEQRFATAGGRIGAARIKARGAHNTGKAYFDLLGALKRTMTTKDATRLTDLHTAQNELAKLEDGKKIYTDTIANLTEEGSTLAGQLGMICDNLGDPAAVRAAAYKIHHIAMVDPTPPPALPEPPSVMDLASEEVAPVVSPPIPASVTPIMLDEKKNPFWDHFLNISPLEWVLTIVIGLILSYTAGFYLGLLNDSVLASKHISFNIIAAAVLGPAILWLTGGGLDWFVSWATKGKSTHRPRFEMMYLVGLGLIVVSCAEINAGANGLKIQDTGRAINAAYRAGGKPSAALLSGTMPVKPSQWLGAFLFCTPYFLFKIAKAHRRETLKIEEIMLEEKEEAAELSKLAELTKAEVAKAAAVHSHATALIEQQKEAWNRKIQARTEQVREYENAQERAKKEALFINNYFSNNPIAGQLLKIAYRIQKALAEAAKFDVPIELALKKVNELLSPLSLDRDALRRLESAYILASQDAAEAYKLAEGDLALTL